MKKLSHVSESGEAKMVDVSEKKETLRTATARAKVFLGVELIEKIKDLGSINAKGPVLHTALIAGIMGAKKTADLIPMCHPISLEDCQINYDFENNDTLLIYCESKVISKTGVEMESLTGVGVAALTIIDMCKSFSKDLYIKEIRLLNKTGGKSDYHYESK